MMQFIYIDEVVLQKNYLLTIHLEGLNCEEVTCLFAVAFSYNSVGTLSDFFT